MKYLIGVVVLVLLVLIGGLTSYHGIDQTERGVILHNGKLVGVANPGINWTAPFITSVVRIPVTEQNQSYPELQAYSKDQQVATMDLSVSFTVQEGNVAEIYRQFGSVENFKSRVLDRQVPQELENVFGQYTAVSAVQDRVKLVADLNKSVKTALANYPVLIQSVQIEGISFSKTFDDSIETRMVAQVAVERKRQELETAKVEAEIAVTQAKAEADSSLAKAEAKAKATRIQGDAEAAAIKAKSDALAGVGSNVVAYTYANKWDGKSPVTVVPNSSITGLALPGSK